MVILANRVFPFVVSSHKDKSTGGQARYLSGRTIHTGGLMFVKSGGRVVDCTVLCTAANDAASLLLWVVSLHNIRARLFNHLGRRWYLGVLTQPRE